MRVRAFGARAFGLRRGIPMEAAQKNVYRSRACIACRHHAIELNTYNPPTCGAPMSHSKVESALDAQNVRKQGASM